MVGVAGRLPHKRAEVARVFVFFAVSKEGYGRLFGGLPYHIKVELGLSGISGFIPLKLLSWAPIGQRKKKWANPISPLESHLPTRPPAPSHWNERRRRRGTAAADGFPPPPLDARLRRIPYSSASKSGPRPDGMARSPAAPTPTHGSPAASTPTPRWPPPPTSTPKSSAADLEEHKGTTELLRAIKIEKANGPDLEEHMGVGELHMEPPKSKKRKRSRQSSGEHHGEHEETNKVVMKPSTSKKKRKASEEMCTNPPVPLLGPLAVDMDKQAPPKSKKRLNKRDVSTKPSLGSLPIDKDKQPSPGSLPVEKNKQPSLSKKVVRSPVLNNVIVSSLARREKKAKSLESSPSQPSLLALSASDVCPSTEEEAADSFRRQGFLGDCVV